MFLQANFIFLGMGILVILLNILFQLSSHQFVGMNWQIWHKRAISSLGRAKDELAEMAKMGIPWQHGLDSSHSVGCEQHLAAMSHCLCVS